jgi:hypothetical protein
MKAAGRPLRAVLPGRKPRPSGSYHIEVVTHSFATARTLNFEPEVVPGWDRRRGRCPILRGDPTSSSITAELLRPRFDAVGLPTPHHRPLGAGGGRVVAAIAGAAEPAHHNNHGDRTTTTRSIPPTPVACFQTERLRRSYRLENRFGSTGSVKALRVRLKRLPISLGAWRRPRGEDGL